MRVYVCVIIPNDCRQKPRTTSARRQNELSICTVDSIKINNRFDLAFADLAKQFFFQFGILHNNVCVFFLINLQIFSMRFEWQAMCVGIFMWERWEFRAPKVKFVTSIVYYLWFSFCGRKNAPNSIHKNTNVESQFVVKHTLHIWMVIPRSFSIHIVFIDGYNCVKEPNYCE